MDNREAFLKTLRIRGPLSAQFGRRALSFAQIIHSATVQHEHASQRQAGGAADETPGQAHGAYKKRKGFINTIGQPDSHA
jgi:hypothetical protein